MGHQLSLTIAAIALLSACGGSSTSTGFSELAAEANALAEVHESVFVNEDYTPLASLPLSGGGNYRGFVGLLIDPPIGFAVSNPDEYDVAGRVEMSVTLADNRVDGSMFDFVQDVDNESIGGVLDIDAELDRTVDTVSQYSILGTVTGQLQSPSAGSVDVDMGLAGDLYGSDRGVLAGFVEGAATTADETLFLSGQFLTTRQ